MPIRGWAVFTCDNHPVLWTIRERKPESISAWMVDYGRKFNSFETWKDSQNRLNVTVRRVIVAELSALHVVEQAKSC